MITVVFRSSYAKLDAFNWMDDPVDFYAPAWVVELPARPVARVYSQHGEGSREPHKERLFQAEVADEDSARALGRLIGAEMRVLDDEEVKRLLASGHPDCPGSCSPESSM